MCTVSGIVTLCKLPYRALIESRLTVRSQSAHGTVWQLTECDDTRYCTHTIFFPPEDEDIDARNMLRSVV